MNYQQFKLKLLNNEGDIDDKKLNLWYELFGELWDICDDILDDSCSPDDTHNIDKTIAYTANLDSAYLFQINGGLCFYSSAWTVIPQSQMLSNLKKH